MITARNQHYLEPGMNADAPERLAVHVTHMAPVMIIGRSSTKFLFFVPIGNPRWLPLQDID
jgi:hypothetical protein